MSYTTTLLVTIIHIGIQLAATLKTLQLSNINSVAVFAEASCCHEAVQVFELEGATPFPHANGDE